MMRRQEHVQLRPWFRGKPPLASPSDFRAEAESLFLKKKKKLEIEEELPHNLQGQLDPVAKLSKAVK